MRDVKLPQKGLKLAQLLTTRAYFCEWMLLLAKALTVLDRSCAGLANSVVRASDFKSEGHGFESHVRLDWLQFDGLKRVLRFDTQPVSRL